MTAEDSPSSTLRPLHDDSDLALPLGLVRIGGLPIESLRCFASPRCLEELAEVWRLEAALGQLRADVADALGRAVPDADKPLRRLLLAVRRACHNGRPLEKYQSAERWVDRLELRKQVGKVLELEEGLRSARARYRSAYEEEAGREFKSLSSLLDHRGFVRGLSFSSPSMAAQLTRLRKNPDSAGRRERRLASSLLRYASRAAFKLSPNSTLTRVAWARFDDSVSETAPLVLPAPPWRETSTLRWQRAALDQLAAVLLRAPSGLRDRLDVTLNPSIGDPVDGIYQFLRPAAWLPGRDGAMRYRPAAVERLDAETPLLFRCAELLRTRALPLGQLSSRLTDELGGDLGPEVRAVLEQFLEIGVLEWLRPWCVPGCHPEAELASCLDKSSRRVEGETAVDALAALVAIECEGETEGIRSSADPASVESPSAEPTERARLSSRAIHHFDQAWNLSRADPAIRRYDTGDRDLSEVVVLSARGAAAGDPLVSLSKEAVEQIVRQLHPWSQLVGIYGHRLEMLLTLSADLRRSVPEGQDRLPIVEAFERTQPLWLAYQRLAEQHRMRAEGWTEVFNPLGLEEIEALATLKRSVFDRLLELTSGSGGDAASDRAAGPIRLLLRDLEELVETVPVEYRSPIGPCLQLQPADSEARSWVMNRFFEGTGRYASRFTVSMAPEPRRRYLDHLMTRSSVQVGGETVHFLDLLCNNSHDLNARHVQTRDVLQLPGEGFEAPPPSGVPMRDLFVDLRAPGRLPRLVGRAGKRYLPVHLGAMALEKMPAMVQFLALFGPGTFLSPRPPVRPRSDVDHTVSPRLDLGNITLQRARWSFDTEIERVQAVVTQDGAEAFEAVQQLRRALSLPPRVFLLERVSARVSKPQFLDLSSPHYVDLFVAALKAQKRVTLVEALPDLGDHPRSTDGRAWATEIQVDARAFPA